jgi:hypothetical protein
MPGKGVEWKRRAEQWHMEEVIFKGGGAEERRKERGEGQQRS